MPGRSGIRRPGPFPTVKIPPINETFPQNVTFFRDVQRPVFSASNIRLSVRFSHVSAYSVKLSELTRPDMIIRQPVSARLAYISYSPSPVFIHTHPLSPSPTHSHLYEQPHIVLFSLLSIFFSVFFSVFRLPFFRRLFLLLSFPRLLSLILFCFIYPSLPPDPLLPSVYYSSVVCPSVCLSCLYPVLIIHAAITSYK